MSRQCTAQLLLSSVFPWFEVSPLSVAQTWHWFTSVNTVLPKIKEDAPESLGLGREGLWQTPTDPLPPLHYRWGVPVSCWGLWGKGRCAVIFAAWVCHSSRRREHNKWRSYSGNDAGALMSSTWDSDSESQVSKSRVSQSCISKLSENGQRETSAKTECLITKRHKIKLMMQV